MPDYDCKWARTIASWSMALADALYSYGFDSGKIFSDAGIDLGGIDTSCSRLPVCAVQKVWKFSDKNTDECFGVKVAQFFGPASFHALGFGFLSSSTLKEMLERLIRYRCVISHMHFAELIEPEGGYMYSFID